MKDFILFILLLFLLAILFGKAKKLKKEDLAKQYKVSRPTLKNWVQHFPGVIPPEKWKSKKTLTANEYSELTELWGSDSKYVLNKKQIVAILESNYKTVSENVKMNLEKIGITWEAWSSCSVFPPVISKRIVDTLS